MTKRTDNRPKPAKPIRVEGGWVCEIWNNDCTKLLPVFIPDKED